MSKLLSTFFFIGIRNLFRNKKRTFISLLAVAIGVWSSAALSTLARGVSYGMAEDTIATLSGHLQLHSVHYLDDPSVEFRFPEVNGALRDALAQFPHWAERVRVPGVIASERETLGVTIVGIHPQAEKGLSFIGEAVVEGAPLDSPEDPGIIVGAKLVERLQSALGKRLVLMSEGNNNEVAERGFRIKGIFKSKLESTELGYVFIGKAVAQSMLGIGNDISEVSIMLHHRDAIPGAQHQLARAAPDLAIDTWESLNPFIVALINVQSRFISFWFVVVFIAVSFGLVNTLLMAIFERSRELGLLQAIGMRPQQIVTMILIESLVLLLVGSILGNLLGLGTMWWLSDGLDISYFAAGAEHIGISRIIFPKFLLADWVRVNGILLVMGVISSLYPAYRAACISPAAALARG